MTILVGIGLLLVLDILVNTELYFIVFFIIIYK